MLKRSLDEAHRNPGAVVRVTKASDSGVRLHPGYLLGWKTHEIARRFWRRRHISIEITDNEGVSASVQQVHTGGLDRRASHHLVKSPCTLCS